MKARDTDTTPYQAVSAPRIRAGRTRGRKLSSAADVAILCQDIATAEREHFIAIYLDVRNRVIVKTTLFVGTVSSVDCHPRDAFRPAILVNAVSVIFVHNHPSGESDPSKQDWDLTDRLRQTGEIIGIPVRDHVIVSDTGFTSLAMTWKSIHNAAHFTF